MRVTVALIAMIAASLLISRSRPEPRVILWTWERTEDLSMVDARYTRLAVLRKSIELRHSGILVRPRMNRLSAPPGTEAISVVRIDSDRGYLPPETEWPMLAREIAAALPPNVRTLQIDL